VAPTGQHQSPRLDPTGAPQTDGPITELLTELVSAAGRGEPQGAAEVILAVDLGESRYTLVREQIPDTDAAPLSSREEEIARMVARGYSNKTVAAVLEISVWTVGTHLRRIYTKLGVHSRTAMVALLAGDPRLGPGDVAGDLAQAWEGRHDEPAGARASSRRRR
jgi:DNA-binding NarL/FixJ family response regulator